VLPITAIGEAVVMLFFRRVFGLLARNDRQPEETKLKAVVRGAA
jgi:hypothetical protein